MSIKRKISQSRQLCKCRNLSPSHYFEKNLGNAAAPLSQNNLLKYKKQLLIYAGRNFINSISAEFCTRGGFKRRTALRQIGIIFKCYIMMIDVAKIWIKQSEIISLWYIVFLSSYLFR